MGGLLTPCAVSYTLPVTVNWTDPTTPPPLSEQVKRVGEGTQPETTKPKGNPMATHTSSLPNLAATEASHRRRRARLDRRIDTLLHRMENDEMADGVALFQSIDKLRLQVATLDAAIQVHVDAAERRELRRELLSA